MREIKELAEFIHTEVDAALGYAKCAVAYHDTRSDLSRTYADLAEAEIGHAKKLHEHAAKLIAEAEQKGRNVPEEMRRKWDDEHKDSIDRMAKAKSYLALLK